MAMEGFNKNILLNDLLECQLANTANAILPHQYGVIIREILRTTPKTCPDSG
jgi:hypothetical protein